MAPGRSEGAKAYVHVRRAQRGAGRSVFPSCRQTPRETTGITRRTSDVTTSVITLIFTKTASAGSIGMVKLGTTGGVGSTTTIPAIISGRAPEPTVMT